MATQIEAVVVETSGEVKKVTLDGSLKSYQEIVGGYIEGVFGPDYVMYVNEEGLLHGLEYNPAASIFAARHLSTQRVHLVGPVLIVGPGDSEGNDTSVHQSTLDYYELEN